MSCSPLVIGETVIVTTGAGDGRSMIAYHVVTSAQVWRAGRDSASYSSPVLLSLLDMPQLLIFNGHSVAAHDPGTGGAPWEHPWPAGHPHIMVPLRISTNRVLVSSGYGTGSALLEVRHAADAWSVQRVWKSIRLKSKFASALVIQGYVYGLDDGVLVCLNAEDGQLQWKEGRYGHGQMILCRDLILVMAENGRVVLLEPSPKGARELAQFKALAGKTWNPPALAGDALFVRNDLEAACYRLPTNVGAGSQ